MRYLQGIQTFSRSRNVLTTRLQFSPGVRHVTLYQFDATRPDELSFRPDQPILVLKRYDDGWCLGELNGLVGMFPAKYARLELRPQHVDSSGAERLE